MNNHPTHTTIKQLNEMHTEVSRMKYPNTPYHPKGKHSDSTANGLTKAIISYLDYIGGHGNRLQSQGQYSPDKVEFVEGRKVIAVKGGWRPGTTKKGTADLMVVLNGVVVMVEVKHGKDKQSAVQKEYQLEIEGAGLPYMIARTFEQFTQDFTKIYIERHG